MNKIIILIIATTIISSCSLEKDPYLISKNSIGHVSDTTMIKDLIQIFKNDSIRKGKLSIGNIISLEDKYYQFKQTSQNNFFGEAFRSSNLFDKVTFENFYNRIYFNYQNTNLGQFKLNFDYHNLNYGYNSVVSINNQIIKNRIKDDMISVGGSYNKAIGSFDFIGEFGINVVGDFNGSFLNAMAKYNFNDDTALKGEININSRAANYNQLLYQSDYSSYNWDNSSLFNNIKTQQFALQFLSPELVNLTFDYTSITNFTYFKKTEDNNLIKPKQEEDPVNYIRLKLNREIGFGKFTLDNTILYQETLSGEDALNMPQIITRNTIYYSNHFFKKALYLQTGITLNYFICFLVIK